eukprot:c18491_g1_i2.p1 GENE.c18491_g1_i2~~c18491_g1_i2.p1  ORF type:complete len:325 (-),score=24.71 c18491_g1_i2:550-1524(-)
MRSLLLIVSLDWFPPFKSQDYSIGVLSATVANLSVTERAKSEHVWTLAVMEGPKEPKHVLMMLGDVFQELAELETRGIEVFDALTNSTATVHATCCVVAADTPACSKLGEHVSHSGYRCCISCRFMGRLCGCKSTSTEEPPAIWDNYGYREGKRTATSGEERPKRRGEHIAWTDTKVLEYHHLASDSLHRKRQVLIMKHLAKVPFVRARYDSLRQRLLVNALSPLYFLPNFSFVLGFSIDAMHTVLKGVVLTMLKLTLDNQHKGYSWNLHHRQGNSAKLVEIMKHFTFLQGPQDRRTLCIVSKVSRLTNSMPSFVFVRCSHFKD